MYSELLAVGQKEGLLHSWPWSLSRPNFEAHPRSAFLGFGSGERVLQLACSMIRCTLMTDKHRVAALMDVSVGRTVADVLESPLRELPEEPSVVFACPLYSVVRTRSGSIYWW